MLNSVLLKNSAPPPKAPRGWTDLLAVLFSFLVLSWLVTMGDWDFFPPGGLLEVFYDAQAHSLLEGHIDVPPEAIGPEAFVRAGKSYGYFGPTPALARIPLELLMPGMHGRWSRASMLAASLLAMLAVLVFARRLERRFRLEGRHKLRALLRAAAVVGVALGSCNLFLCAESKVFQEAIIWGAALALAHAVFLFCYLTEPRSLWLALACSAAFFSFFARVSTGAGALLSLALVDAAILFPSLPLSRFLGAPAIPRRPAAIAMTATLCAAALFWAALNYAKFGAFLASTPVQMHVQYDRERLARIKGSLYSLDNLPLTATCYLVPGHVRFGARFPWVYLSGGPDLPQRFPNAHIDGIEPYASIPSSTPALLLAALCGTLLCFASRRPELRVCRAPVAGALAGCSLVFIIGFITYRYFGDLVPWLALGSVVSIVAIPLLNQDRLRHGIVAALLVLTGYGVWANFAFAIVQQRFYAFPIPQEKRIVFADFTDAVRRDGLAAIPAFLTASRKYIAASAFSDGNVAVDHSPGRGDQPVIVSQAGPASAEYLLPLLAGRYEIAVRCASPDPRPLTLLLNQRPAANVCNLATGGWMPEQQHWFVAGAFTLPQGMNHLALASQGPFPAVSLIRLTRID